MPQVSKQQIEALQEDLTCPNCEYNLRGLPGNIINCPECGERCDIPKLILLQLHIPWYKAPYLNDQVIPIAWLFFMVLLVMINRCAFGQTPLAFIGDMLLIISGLVGWGWLLCLQWKKDRDAWNLKMSLLQHLFFIGYIFSVLAMLSSFFLCLDCIAYQKIPTRRHRHRRIPGSHPCLPFRQ